MLDANREHKSTLARMEQKFFEEKVTHSRRLMFHNTCLAGIFVVMF